MKNKQNKNKTKNQWNPASAGLDLQSTYFHHFLRAVPKHSTPQNIKTERLITSFIMISFSVESNLILILSNKRSILSSLSVRLHRCRHDSRSNVMIFLTWKGITAADIRNYAHIKIDSFSICAQKDSILKDSVIFGSFLGLGLTMWVMINRKHSKRKSFRWGKGKKVTTRPFTF